MGSSPEGGFLVPDHVMDDMFVDMFKPWGERFAKAVTADEKAKLVAERLEGGGEPMRGIDLGGPVDPPVAIQTINCRSAVKMVGEEVAYYMIDREALSVRWGNMNP